MKNIDTEQFKKVANESKTMTEASAKLGLHFNTFKRWALKLGVWQPNAGTKGMNIPSSKKFKTEDILDGKHPGYAPHRLKKRLVEESYKEDKCEECGLENTWNGNPLTLELDHIDGDRTNNSLDNLKILCPNCHTQTCTYKSKNKGRIIREITG